MSNSGPFIRLITPHERPLVPLWGYPTTEHLTFLEEMLSGFNRVKVDSSIKSQLRWSHSAVVNGRYPVGKDEDLKKKTTVNLAWMLTENTDDETALLLQIISGILIGSAAGPLRKALIDSGLGEDLSPVTGWNAI